MHEAPFQLPAGQIHCPLTVSRILPPEHGSKHEYPFQTEPVGQTHVFKVVFQVCPPKQKTQMLPFQF